MIINKYLIYSNNNNIWYNRMFCVLFVVYFNEQIFIGVYWSSEYSGVYRCQYDSIIVNFDLFLFVNKLFFCVKLCINFIF